MLLLDDEFRFAGQVSWTNLAELGAVHSGDITEAPDGATEFIDLDLDKLAARYVIPQVNVYSGEGFDDIEECALTWPQLTSVRCDVARFGRESAEAMLAFVEGRSHDEIARLTTNPLGSVKSWIRRGLLALKECLSTDRQAT